MSALDIIEDATTVIAPQEPGDHDRFSHYVRKEDIIRSTFDSVPVTALCGKTWIANKSPEKYPVCPDCKAVYEDDQKFLGSNL